MGAYHPCEDDKQICQNIARVIVVHKELHEEPAYIRESRIEKVEDEHITVDKPLSENKKNSCSIDKNVDLLDRIIRCKFTFFHDVTVWVVHYRGIKTSQVLNF